MCVISYLFLINRHNCHQLKMHFVALLHDSYFLLPFSEVKLFPIPKISLLSFPFQMQKHPRAVLWAGADPSRDEEINQPFLIKIENILIYIRPFHCLVSFLKIK